MHKDAIANGAVTSRVVVVGAATHLPFALLENTNARLTRRHLCVDTTWRNRHRGGPWRLRWGSLGNDHRAVPSPVWSTPEVDPEGTTSCCALAVFTTP